MTAAASLLQSAPVRSYSLVWWQEIECCVPSSAGTSVPLAVAAVEKSLGGGNERAFVGPEFPAQQAEQNAA